MIVYAMCVRQSWVMCRPTERNDQSGRRRADRVVHGGVWKVEVFAYITCMTYMHVPVSMQHMRCDAVRAYGVCRPIWEEVVATCLFSSMSMSICVSIPSNLKHAQ